MESAHEPSQIPEKTQRCGQPIRSFRRYRLAPTESSRQPRHAANAQGWPDVPIVSQEVHNYFSVIAPTSFFRHLSRAVVDAHGQAVDEGIGGVGDDVVGGGDALQDFHGLAEVAPDPNGA